VACMRPCARSEEEGEFVGKAGVQFFLKKFSLLAYMLSRRRTQVYGGEKLALVRGYRIHDCITTR
jgi:hypothetical protein